MNLYKMILELKDLDECYRFFQDLCTVSELVYQGEYTIDNNGMQCPKGTEKIPNKKCSVPSYRQ